ncbi:MAG: hypothetical protein IJS52_10395 [Bacilli bacterium]|nr:hypothetical protein [Bacilli bacterium]
MTYSQTYGQGSLFMNYMNAKTYLESHRDDRIPSFALTPYSAGYITERLQTRVIVVILDPKTLVIIAGPYEQLTPVTYPDHTGHSPKWWNPTTWDWDAIGKGLGLVLLGAGAIVAGIATLPYGGWAAVLGGVTILAGGGTVVFGLADTWEGMSGYNGLKETVFMGNQQAYDITENTFKWTAIVGSVACGIYGWTHTSMFYCRSTPRLGEPNSALYNVNSKVLTYYNSKGVIHSSLGILEKGHQFIHWHMEIGSGVAHTLPINDLLEYIYYLWLLR